jgi:hypothetical protein
MAVLFGIPQMNSGSEVQSSDLGNLHGGRSCRCVRSKLLQVTAPSGE